MEDTGHWYTTTGAACHTVPKKDGKGERATTIADARRLDLLPSVTSVIRILEKPALIHWMVRQGVHAVATAPDVPGEALDAKITRILDIEEQQHEEAQIARDLGTDIHDAMDRRMSGRGDSVPEKFKVIIEPAAQAVEKYGEYVTSEKVVVGKGYAGRVDLIQKGEAWWLWDWKSAKTLPTKGSWPEHVLQLAAYAGAYWLLLEMMGRENWEKPIRTANCYLSTTEPGKFAIFENDPDWQRAYNGGFTNLLRFWSFWKGYVPQGVTL